MIDVDFDFALMIFGREMNMTACVILLQSFQIEYERVDFRSGQEKLNHRNLASFNRIEYPHSFTP